jgi:hypothetical protein
MVVKQLDFESMVTNKENHQTVLPLINPNAGSSARDAMGHVRLDEADLTYDMRPALAMPRQSVNSLASGGPPIGRRQVS